MAAALKNASAAAAAQTGINVSIPASSVATTRVAQVSNANLLSSPAGATIRLQLQQFQLQQLQQQQKQIQQKLQQVAQQSSAAAKSGTLIDVKYSLLKIHNTNVKSDI